MKGHDLSGLSPKECLVRAFQMYEENPMEALVEVTDQIFYAATFTPKLVIKPASRECLAITIGDDDKFEVGLPFKSLSTFRTILARVGIICKIAAAQVPITDRTATERKEQVIEYVRAVIRDQPGSPLYKIDADLGVRHSDKSEKTLHVMMRNENTLERPFLAIESRKTK